MNCGVYVIQHRDSNKCYVGSSIDLVKRFKTHRKQLENNVHHSKKLQRAWNKYGPNAFDISVALYCDADNRLMYEQIVIDAMQASTVGYNICHLAKSRLGVTLTPEEIQTRKVAQRASPRRKKYDWKGQKLCLVEICELENKVHKVVNRRIEDGWSLEDAVNIPHNKYVRKWGGLGLVKSLNEWAEYLGYAPNFLRRRLRSGMSIEDCVGLKKALTVHELARLSGVDDKMFHARIKAEWSVGDALAYPKVAKGGQHFKKRVYAS